MSYVKNIPKATPHESVNQLNQSPKNNGLSVLPPYAAIVPTKTAESLPGHDGIKTKSISGKHFGIIQKKGTAAAVSGAVTAADPNLVIDPPKPGINKTGFIDIDDGANIRTRPAESGGQMLTNQSLPPATRVFVGGYHPEAPQWWYVNAYCSDRIVRGYVQQFRITTDLPELGAQLYQVKNGDTVEKLARREFASGVRDGHDLRYYENVLLYVNRQAGRAGIEGTFQSPNLFGGGSNNIQLVAGKRIWLVNPGFAKQLESIVPSGSFSGGAVAKAERIYGHVQDIVKSVTDSPQYFAEVAGEYAEMILAHLPEIITTVVGFVLAEAVSAGLAASPTGLGQLAALLIQLILAFMGVKALVESLGEVLEHAGKWLQLAWAASGEPRKLGEASKEFLRMLVSIAIAVLSILGIKGNVGKSLRLKNTIKIEPPSIGFSPALATSAGPVIGGGISLYPGSIASTGPVNLGIYSSMASGPGKGLGEAIKTESRKNKVKDEPIKEVPKEELEQLRGKYKSLEELPAFWREKAYSLVEVYNKLSRPGSKTIAATKSGKTAVSGYGTTDSAERLLTEQVIAKQKQIGQTIENSGAFDQGKDGYYFACHAEKKLSVIAPDEPIAVKGPLHCANCQNYFELLAKYTGKTQIILNSKFLYIYTPQGKIVVPK